MKRVGHVCQEHKVIALIAPKCTHTTVIGLGQCVPPVTLSARGTASVGGEETCKEAGTSHTRARSGFRGGAWAGPRAEPQRPAWRGPGSCRPSGLGLWEDVLPAACRGRQRSAAAPGRPARGRAGAEWGVLPLVPRSEGSLRVLGGRLPGKGARAPRSFGFLSSCELGAQGLNCGADLL